MNIKEFYDYIGEDYGEVIGRLRLESRVVKYVSFFSADACFNTLCSAVAEKRYSDAFRAAHTLKGICLNLGFGGFHDVVSDITEKLRHFEENERIEADGSIALLLKDAEDKYNRIIEGINALDK